MTEDNQDFTVPSDPEVRKRIRGAVAEGAAVLQKIDDNKSALKDIRGMAEEDLGVPKRTFNKMVKAFHKQQFTEIVHENEVFQAFYEQVMEDPA